MANSLSWCWALVWELDRVIPDGASIVDGVRREVEEYPARGDAVLRMEVIEPTCRTSSNARGCRVGRPPPRADRDAVVVQGAQHQVLGAAETLGDLGAGELLVDVDTPDDGDRQQEDGARRRRA
jgi:hypothetical protein